MGPLIPKAPKQPPPPPPPPPPAPMADPEDPVKKVNKQREYAVRRRNSGRQSTILSQAGSGSGDKLG